MAMRGPLSKKFYLHTPLPAEKKLAMFQAVCAENYPELLGLVPVPEFIGWWGGFCGDTFRFWTSFASSKEVLRDKLSIGGVIRDENWRQYSYEEFWDAVQPHLVKGSDGLYQLEFMKRLDDMLLVDRIYEVAPEFFVIERAVEDYPKKRKKPRI